MKTSPRFRRAARLAALVLAAVLLFLQFGLGFVVRHGMQTFGSDILGCDIAVRHCSLRLLTGVVDMRDVVVGPPEGFDANLFEMDRLHVEFSPLSAFGPGPLRVSEIAVTNVLVSYELKGLDSNVSAVLDKLGAGDKPEGDGKEEAPEEDGKEEEKASGETEEGKKLVIDRFVFSGAKVRAAFWDGKGVKPPLPTIELTDLGAQSGGVTALEATASIMGSIGRGVIGLVADLGGAVADAAAAVGGAVADGAEVVGGAVADGAEVVGDAVVDGAKAVGDAIGNLFDGD